MILKLKRLATQQKGGADDEPVVSGSAPKRTRQPRTQLAEAIVLRDQRRTKAQRRKRQRKAVLLERNINCLMLTRCATGDPDELLEAYNGVLKLDPRHEEALYEKARTLIVAKRLKEAIEAAHVLLKAHPTIEKGHYLLALALSDEGNELDRAGDHNAALEIFHEALIHLPASGSDPKVTKHRLFLHVCAADAASMLWSSAERATCGSALHTALAHADSCLALAPGNKIGLEIRLEILVLLQRDTDALAAARTLLAVNPTDTLARDIISQSEDK